MSGESGGIGLADLDGLGWPPLIGMIAGVLVAGLAGLLFSPIAARLRGIYLGVASLGLVFIGQHVLNSWTSVTGGFNGRSAPEFSLFGFTFGNTDPDLFVLGVPFREAERLWYLGLVLALAAYLFARNLLRSRPGRALQTLRDSEVAASVMGVNVQGYKARVFLVSSMYAGLAGVMYALSIGSIAPESFGLELSILFLAMIVLGGLGSVGGAALGAVFVSALPLIFQRYADVVPFVGGAGEGGLAPGEAARYFFGLAIILVVLFEPAGLAGFAGRFRRKGRDPGGGRPPARLRRTSSSTTDRSVRPTSTREHHMKLGKGSRSAVVAGSRRGCRGVRLQQQGTGEQRRRRRRRGRRRPTDIGVEGETIRLGVLTDLTGVFAALGKDITNANELFWEDNQVCDTYDVELDIQDTGYVPQQGVQLYSGMKDNVLAMQQTIGSPINTALAPEYEADQIVNFPSAWSKTLTEIPGTGVVGATYDVEIANGYDYMFQEGLLKEGDTVGHIYFEGEYGANGLAGSQAVAEEKGLELIEAQIKSTDQDMSSQVTQFKAAGVDMIALTVAPGQLASVAAVMEAQGLDVPDPRQQPGLRARSAPGPVGRAG